MRGISPPCCVMLGRLAPSSGFETEVNKEVGGVPPSSGFETEVNEGVHQEKRNFLFLPFFTFFDFLSFFYLCLKQKRVLQWKKVRKRWKR
jgi:hypothetical protein